MDVEYFGSAITVLYYFHEDRYSIRRDSLALSVVKGSQMHNSREKLLCLRQFTSEHPGLLTMCLSLYLAVREKLVLLHLPRQPLLSSLTPSHCPTFTITFSKPCRCSPCFQTHRAPWQAGQDVHVTKE